MPIFNMMEITAEQIIELFEKDARARKRMAELLVTEPDVRLAIINAVLRDVATKQDIKDMATKQDIVELRKTLEARMNSLDARINGLETKISSLETKISGLDARINSLDTRINGLETKTSSLETKISGLDARMNGLDARMDMVTKELDRLFKLVIVSVLGILISITTTILVKILLP